MLTKAFRYQSLGYESSKSPSPRRKTKKSPANRDFDSSKYSTRLIALKFAYLGQRYNGLEYHPNSEKPLPTIEEEVWKALNKACLIFPTPNTSIEVGDVNWDGCDYSKCGRTDKGVSAFGQVIGIRVRSNRPLSRLYESKPATELVSGCIGNIDIPPDEESTSSPLDHTENNASFSTSKIESCITDSSHFDPVRDEIPYTHVLNRLLPPDIRMLAWCPSPPPDFSARFSCRERRYRYFFTQPAFTPTYGELGFTEQANHVVSSEQQQREGWLDIEAMRKAVKYFEGLHDFRNFCKVDPGKQVTNFERRVFYAAIEEVPLDSSLAGHMCSPGFQEHIQSIPNQEPINSSSLKQTSTPKIYTFTLHGSAFLWHQVRCMVAILFLIGQGLEPPNLVPKLLDIQSNPERPMYEMAEDTPLVLWDCIFPAENGNPREDALEWIYAGDDGDKKNPSARKPRRTADGRHGHGGVVDNLWKVWHGRKMDEVLAGSLLDMVVRQGNKIRRDNHHQPNEKEEEGNFNNINPPSRSMKSHKVFLGGDSPRLVGNYTPVLDKPRMDSIEVINSRYAAKKGVGLLKSGNGE